VAGGAVLGAVAACLICRAHTSGSHHRGQCACSMLAMQIGCTDSYASLAACERDLGMRKALTMVTVSKMMPLDGSMACAAAGARHQ
jgi:hypothetical protein